MRGHYQRTREGFKGIDSPPGGVHDLVQYRRFFAIWTKQKAEYGHFLLDNYFGRLPLEVRTNRDAEAARLISVETWAMTKEP